MQKKVTFEINMRSLKVNCPVCGEYLVKGSESKYNCENESCPVIFVRCPSEPAKKRVAYTSFVRKEIQKGPESYRNKDKSLF